MQQALPSQLGQALVELAAKTAELVVTGVAQGQYGIGQPGAVGALLALQGLPECRAAVGRVAIAKGAGDQHHTGNTLQLAWADRLQTAELHAQTSIAQARGAAFGQLLTIAGLRGPQHLMPWRGLCRDGRSCRLGEQPGQQTVDKQTTAGSQRRTGRQAGYALGAGLVQTQQETLQVMTLFFGQHRNRLGVQAKQTGQGGGRHADRLYSGSVQIKGVDALACDPLQGYGAVFEGWLQRQRVDRIAGRGIDRQLLADQVIPVKRRKAVARHDPVTDARRQHGVPPA
ncbi:hypothetical protein D9M71_348440 [compost metagenome]